MLEDFLNTFSIRVTDDSANLGKGETLFFPGNWKKEVSSCRITRHAIATRDLGTPQRKGFS